MTEIPEHLLKRAAERRAAMTGGAAPADAPAEAAPAAGAPAADAPAAAAPAKKAPAPLPTLDDEPAKVVPDIPVVAAAKARKRAPYWATALLASLPLWAFMYYYAIAQPPAHDTGVMAIGGEVYAAKCVSCHGADGSGGGAGAQLNDGHVIDTFADPLTMVHWIAFGYQGGARPDGTYGDNNRPRITGAMPGWRDQITPEEIAAVTIYVRQEISGGDPADDPNFNSEVFDADPAALAEMVQKVIDLGATGEPDVSGIEGAETEG